MRNFGERTEYYILLLFLISLGIFLWGKLEGGKSLTFCQKIENFSLVCKATLNSAKNVEGKENWEPKYVAIAIVHVGTHYDTVIYGSLLVLNFSECTIKFVLWLTF